MLEAARRGAREASRVDANAKDLLAAEEKGRPDAREEGRPDERSSFRSHLKVIGVTLLTSLAASDLDDIGLAGGVSERALALAELAHATGLDGVVCAPTEAEMLRRRFGSEFLLVTPGVRPSGSPAQDQQRVLTPAEAVARGADLLVIGRPITRAEDPRASLDRIRNEISER